MASEEKFCRLCGKIKETDFITLAQLHTGVIYRVDACERCQKVVHNIRVLVNEAEESAARNEKALAERKIVVVKQMPNLPRS